MCPQQVGGLLCKHMLPKAIQVMSKVFHFSANLNSTCQTCYSGKVRGLQSFFVVNLFEGRLGMFKYIGEVLLHNRSRGFFMVLSQSSHNIKNERVILLLSSSSKFLGLKVCHIYGYVLCHLEYSAYCEHRAHQSAFSSLVTKCTS